MTIRTRLVIVNLQRCGYDRIKKFTMEFKTLRYRDTQR